MNHNAICPNSIRSLLALSALLKAYWGHIKRAAFYIDSKLLDENYKMYVMDANWLWNRLARWRWPTIPQGNRLSRKKLRRARNSTLYPQSQPRIIREKSRKFTKCTVINMAKIVDDTKLENELARQIQHLKMYVERGQENMDTLEEFPHLWKRCLANLTCPSNHWGDLSRRTAHQLSPIPKWTRAPRISEDENRQDGQWYLWRACIV